MKVWQKKLGCQSKTILDILYNKKISNIVLDDMLEELIVLLLCTVCANPEIYKEKKKIFIKCKACGNERKAENDLKKILLTECI